MNREVDDFREDLQITLMEGVDLMTDRDESKRLLQEVRSGEAIS